MGRQNGPGVSELGVLVGIKVTRTKNAGARSSGEPARREKDRRQSSVIGRDAVDPTCRHKPWRSDIEENRVSTPRELV